MPWKEAGKSNVQVNIKIINSSSNVYDHWCLKMDIPKDAELIQSWSATYKINNDSLDITCVDYNQQILPKQTIEFGYIIRTQKKFSLGKSELNIDGQIYK